MLMHVPTGNPRGAAMLRTGTAIDATTAASKIALFIRTLPIGRRLIAAYHNLVALPVCRVKT
ncbi:hypothetical protein BWQ93_10760 [Sphingopyxis sp. QXT-31]|nr:hypothetical protein BWQ93_10760 [Sphingopyxis sp. QXT-31]